MVVVGATNLHCKQLHGDLRSILDHILEHHPQFITRSETGDVDIVYADETLAALWQTSAAAQQDMGDQPPLVRRAVSPPGYTALSLSGLSGENARVDEVAYSLTNVSACGVCAHSTVLSPADKAPLCAMHGLGAWRKGLLISRCACRRTRRTADFAGIVSSSHCDRSP